MAASVQSSKSAVNTQRPRETEVLFWKLATGCVAAKLWLVAAQSMSAFYLPHDDHLFLSLAQSVLQGEWLGAYTNLRLAKGPIFPLWIAGLHAAGAPLRPANQVLYVLAALLAVIALRPLVARPLHRGLIFAFLVFDPMTFASDVTTRVLREGIYPALTLIVAACAIGFQVRAREGKTELLSWSAGFGFAFAAFWFTREEGVVLLPFVAIVSGLTALAIWRGGAPDRRVRLALVALPFVCWGAVATTLAAVNRWHYGTSTIVEFKQRGFVAAYGALSRVKHKSWRPMLPVPVETRERIYEVSPAFAELRPHLEGAMGKSWARASGGKDIGGGWFAWALRDAAGRVGHHSSAADAATYYRNLAEEVNAACGDGRLECFGPRATLAPPWRRGYLVPVARALAKGAWRVASVAQFHAAAEPSEPDLDLQRFYREMTRSSLEPANSGGGPRTVARGWAFGPGGDVQMAVRSSSGTALDVQIEFKASHDIYRQARASGLDLVGAKRARFTITSTARDGAWIEFLVAGRLVARAPLDGSLRSGRSMDLVFQLDYVEGDEGRFTRIPRRTDTLRRLGLTGIAWGYRVTLPLLVALAAAAFIRRGIVLAKAGKLDEQWIIMLALLLAASAKLSLLALIDVTSFVALSPLYLCSVSPLLMMFVVIAGLPLAARSRG